MVEFRSSRDTSSSRTAGTQHLSGSVGITQVNFKTRKMNEEVALQMIIRHSFEAHLHPCHVLKCTSSSFLVYPF